MAPPDRAVRGPALAGRVARCALLCLLVLAVACTEAAPEEGAAPVSEAPRTLRLDDPQLPTELTATEFRGPITITEGGTYDGSFASDEAGVPAVTVSTTAPVTITDSLLTGRGALVVSGVAGVDLTIRNSRAIGLNPRQDGVEVGRFVAVERPSRLVIEHNEIRSTAGISVLEWDGDGSPEQTLTIAGNEVVNIDGRTSNGSGEPGAAGFHGEDQITARQFVQLDKVQGVPGIEIAWNHVRNHPGDSRVEDNISIYLSGGTPDSPIDIHDNLIDGAYPLDPSNDEFSGGGIMLGDGQGDPIPEYATATANTVLNTANYGIAVSAGNNMAIADNRVLSTGRLPDGEPIASQNVGIYVWNIHNQDGFYANEARGNEVGWERPLDSGRNDFYAPELDLGAVNDSFDDEVTKSVIRRERRQWRARANDAGVRIGPGE